MCYCVLWEVKLEKLREEMVVFCGFIKVFYVNVYSGFDCVY